MGLSYAVIQELANITVLVCDINGYKKPQQTQEESLALGLGLGLGLFVVLTVSCFIGSIWYNTGLNPCKWYCYGRNPCNSLKTYPSPAPPARQTPEDITLDATQVSILISAEAYWDYLQGNLSWVLKEELDRAYASGKDMAVFLRATEYTAIANYIRKLQNTQPVIVDVV